MGLAIIIPNISFSANKLGTVTFSQDADLTTIVVTSNKGASLTGMEIEDWYNVSYNIGVASNKKGVTFSLASTTYATIDSLTGKITIKTNANNSTITVIATSIYDSTVKGTIQLTVTYKETGLLDLSRSAMVVNGGYINSILQNGGCMLIEANIVFPESWGGNSYSLTPFDGGHICAKVAKETSYNNRGNTIRFTEGRYNQDNYFVTLQNSATICTDHIIFSKTNGIIIDGETIMAEPNQTGEQWQYPLCYNGSRMMFNRYSQEVSLTDDLTQTRLDEWLKSVADSGQGLPNDYTFKLKKFIVFTNKDYATKEEMIENRSSAIIDLQFDENDNPINAGTNKTFNFLLSTIE